jgi:putative sigma-54 modulation protein
MEIAVHGRHVAVPAELRKLTEEKVGHLGRFLEGMERAEVRFVEERNPRIPEPVGCEITVVGHGHVVRAKASGAEPTTALDRVIDKTGIQLSRLKKKLIGRSHPHHGHTLDKAGAGAPATLDGLGKAGRTNGRGTLNDDYDEDEEGARGPAGNGTVWLDNVGARIVRAKRFSIKPMTPEEAVLQMELLSHDFFFFANAETDRPAVVYRRSDGDFGLIDAT